MKRTKSSVAVAGDCTLSLVRMVEHHKEAVLQAKPFLKWAGGKTQILPELEKRLPEQMKDSKKIERYVEPFVGGGAFFFYLKRNYEVKESYLFDINRELIIGYKVIKDNPEELIIKLSELQENYLKESHEERKKFFYETRRLYNQQMLFFDYDTYNKDWIKRASFLIFLNKTCFNGLFRQNKKGEFNVPFGDYNNPKIINKENILEVHKALQDAEIFCGDFTKSEQYIEKDTLVYLDPPYLPISGTSSFTSYSKEDFTEKDQIRLAEFFKKIEKIGANLILSNSDPKNEDPANDFFDKLYKKYIIDRVLASRMINCNGSRRGQINELIITN